MSATKDHFDKEKSIIKEDAYNKFYKEIKSLYIENRCVRSKTKGCPTAN